MFSKVLGMATARSGRDLRIWFGYTYVGGFHDSCKETAHEPKLLYLNILTMRTDNVVPFSCSCLLGQNQQTGYVWPIKIWLPPTSCQAHSGFTNSCSDSRISKVLFFTHYWRVRIMVAVKLKQNTTRCLHDVDRNTRFCPYTAPCHRSVAANSCLAVVWWKVSATEAKST